MNRMILASLLLLPMAAGAYSTGTTLGGTTTTVNAGPGAQTDPHLDGNLVAYTSQITGGTEIRYFDFATSIDLAIPYAPGSYDFLSDVSGGTVVFTRVGAGKSSIWSFNTTTTGPAVELAPQASSNRRGAAIGGTTVAWQDLSFATSSEIVAYDMGASVATRLTEDALFDANPSVAPGGNVVVWQKCANSVSPCDIWQAVKTGTSWGLATAVTSTAEGESSPDTNGTLVVYGAARAASPTSPDIYWTPVAGGIESQLALPGEQQNPNISGNVIAFEGRSMLDPTPNWDIYLYDLSTTTLYRLTDTPLLDETLNDVSVSGTQARVVWSVNEAGDYNVYGYTFSFAAPAPVVDAGQPGDDDCHGHGRGRGHHQHGNGNGYGHERHGECDDGDGHDDGHDNDDGEDDDGDEDHSGRPGHHDQGHARGGGHSPGHHHAASQGMVASVSASGVHSFAAPDSAAGCSSSGGGSMIAGLLALLGVLLLGRTRATVSVRRDNRR